MKLINRLKDILANWSEEKKGLPKDIVEFAEEAMDDWKWCIDEDPDEIENMGSVKDFLEMYDSAKPKKTEPKKPEPPKNEPKPPKADKPKDEKKPTKDDTKKPTKEPKQPKQPKVSKEAFAEKPYWFFILESYIKSYAGKSKQQWRVRQFLKFINCTCNADLQQQTPHIDLIRKIRKEIVKAGNSSDKMVDIPSNSSLVADCKEAIKKYSISKKLQREAIKEIALSGL